MRDLSVVAALLSTSDVLIALGVIVSTLVAVTRYGLIPFSKICYAGYKAFNDIGPLRQQVSALSESVGEVRRVVGQNGKESVFQMLHQLSDKQGEHSRVLAQQNQTLADQNETLAHQNKTLETLETDSAANSAALEVLMKASS